MAKKTNHNLKESSLSNEAMDRVKAKHLEEYLNSIFSFALENKLHIVGIRENEDFHVLWYDPEHEICPSAKRST